MRPPPGGQSPARGSPSDRDVRDLPPRVISDLIPFSIVDAAGIIRQTRQRSRLSRRALARRARTSAATLSAYESGRIVPSVETLDRIVRAAGFTITPSLVRALEVSDAERSRELVDV